MSNPASASSLAVSDARSSAAPAVDWSRQVHLTYLYLRLVLAGASISLPLVLIVGGWVNGVPTQATLSNYYFAEFPPAVLRSAFVGPLSVMGALLIIYRGYTERDNLLHNLAGMCALAVALFPMECPYLKGDPSRVLCDLNLPRLHYPSAIALFGIALFSIWSGGGKAFREDAMARVPASVVRFDRVKWGAMLVILVGVFLATIVLLFGGKSALGGWVWLLESLAFWGFGIYWIALTVLVEKVNAVPPRTPVGGQAGDAASSAPPPRIWP